MEESSVPAPPRPRPGPTASHTAPTDALWAAWGGPWGGASGGRRAGAAGGARRPPAGMSATPTPLPKHDLRRSDASVSSAAAAAGTCAGQAEVLIYFMEAGSYVRIYLELAVVPSIIIL